MPFVVSLIFFRSDHCDLAVAHEWLIHERGIVATRADNEIEVYDERNPSDVLQIRFADGEGMKQMKVQLPVNSLGRVEKYDACFEILVDANVDISDYPLLEVVRETLQYAADGVLLIPATGDIIDAPEKWTLCTGPLTSAQFDDEICAMAALFMEAGMLTLSAYFGFGCRCDALESPANISAQTSLLPDFIRHHESIGVYVKRKCDLRLQDPEGRARFLLCHESDIHFWGSDELLLQKVRERWSRLYKKSTELNVRNGLFESLQGDAR